MGYGCSTFSFVRIDMIHHCSSTFQTSLYIRKFTPLFKHSLYWKHRLTQLHIFIWDTWCSAPEAGREFPIICIAKPDKISAYINFSGIRRDLIHLESQGLIQRDHGGASELPYIPGMAPFLSRLNEDKKGKLSIIRAAADLIKPHCTMYVDSSTMAMDIYQYVSSDMNLTVFTNNTLLAHLLAEKKNKNILHWRVHFKTKRCDNDRNLCFGNAKKYLCRFYIFFIFGANGGRHYFRS